MRERQQAVWSGCQGHVVEEGEQEEGGGESAKSAYLNGTDAGVGAGGEGEPGLEHIRHRVRVCGLQCLVRQTDKRGLV